jgi:hypothetical protein
MLPPYAMHIVLLQAYAAHPLADGINTRGAWRRDRLCCALEQNPSHGLTHDFST